VDKNLDLDDNAIAPSERPFHESLKPSWGPDGTLVYAAAPEVKTMRRFSKKPEKDGLLVVQKSAVVSERRDIRFAHFSHEVCL
jgi:nuclear pore complex protein Nup98-Nup96